MSYMIPLAQIEARRSAMLPKIDALRSKFKDRTFWFRRKQYEPLKCVDVLAIDPLAEALNNSTAYLWLVDEQAKFVFQTATGDRVTENRRLSDDPFAWEVFFTRDQ